MVGTISTVEETLLVLRSLPHLITKLTDKTRRYYGTKQILRSDRGIANDKTYYFRTKNRKRKRGEMNIVKGLEMLIGT